MKSGIIIKRNKANKLLIVPSITDSVLFQIVPIISEELLPNRDIEDSLQIIKKRLSDNNIVNIEFIDILAEIH